ncbi:MAG: histone deacetylase family protein [Chloroflexia bacterium]|nr:histone deacetylase family protein [Chloroflexia bacterium]
MHIISSPTHTQHMPPHEFYDGALIPPFESAERAHIIDRALQVAGYTANTAITSVPTEILHAIHDPAYLHYLATIYPRWCAAGGAPEAVLPSTLAVRWMHRHSPHPLAEAGYYAFDLSAPIVAHSWDAIIDSASMAYTAAQLLLAGVHHTYARCRPPGHHAGSDMCGGYCYVNNAAVAAQTLSQRGTVAILDIDIHHGNGTQQIFYGRGDVQFISIHGHPDECYPYFLGFADEQGEGAGLGANHNYPLAFGCDDTQYLAVVDAALQRVRDFGAQTLVVSAGFDTFAADPLGGFKLSRACYTAIGHRIRQLGLPVAVIQEGGYAIAALGDNVVALLDGLQGG